MNKYHYVGNIKVSDNPNPYIKMKEERKIILQIKDLLLDYWGDSTGFKTDGRPFPDTGKIDEYAEKIYNLLTP